MENEGDPSCLKIYDHPMERFGRFEDVVCNDDKVKVHVEKFPSHAKILIEEGGAEVNTQLIDYPAKTW